MRDLRFNSVREVIEYVEREAHKRIAKADRSQSSVRTLPSDQDEEHVTKPEPRPY